MPLRESSEGITASSRSNLNRAKRSLLFVCLSNNRRRQARKSRTLRHERDLRTHQACEKSETTLEGLRRALEDGRQLGASAALPGMRGCGLLRFLEEQERDKAF